MLGTTGVGRPRVELPLGLIASNTVTLLNFADELLTASLDPPDPSRRLIDVRQIEQV
jgi:hypothetical protein